MYRITYTQGNGHNCNCCRQSWKCTKDLDTKEEVVNWLNELEACQKESLKVNDDDRCVDEIREMIDEDLYYELKADPIKVQEMVEVRRKIKEQKKKDEEEKARIEEERKKINCESS